MTRRIVLALALALGLTGASAALAQSSGAKAAVDAAKAKGVVGEQGDGYLGFVGGADPAVKAAMDEINAGRSKAYQDIAAKTGVTPAAAGEATALQLAARLPAGYYYRPLGGEWVRK